MWNIIVISLTPHQANNWIIPAFILKQYWYCYRALTVPSLHFVSLTAVITFACSQESFDCLYPYYGTNSIRMFTETKFTHFTLPCILVVDVSVWWVPSVQWHRLFFSYNTLPVCCKLRDSCFKVLLWLDFYLFTREQLVLPEMCAWL